MRLSKTSKYALRTLSFISGKPEELFSAEYLYTNLKIPKRYLRRLLTELSKSELLISVRGKYGGFKLGKGADEIFLADIIESVEGLDEFNSCILGFDSCAFSSACAMHNVWANTKQEILNILQNTSLAQVSLSSPKQH